MGLFGFFSNGVLFLELLLLETSLGDRQEKGAVKAILFAMLAQWRLGLHKDVASVMCK